MGSGISFMGWDRLVNRLAMNRSGLSTGSRETGEKGIKRVSGRERSEILDHWGSRLSCRSQLRVSSLDYHPVEDSSLSRLSALCRMSLSWSQNRLLLLAVTSLVSTSCSHLHASSSVYFDVFRFIFLLDLFALTIIHRAILPTGTMF